MNRRLHVSFLWAVAVLLAGTTAQASWNGTGQLVHGTANTLEQGEIMIGVFTPLAYGVNDSMTLVTHPIMTLLLTPNAGFRWRVLDEKHVDLAFSLEGVRSFAAEELEGIRDENEPMGHVASGFTATFDLNNKVLISTLVGYQRDILPDSNLMTMGGTVHWLMSPVHLFTLQGSGRFNVTTNEWETPTVTLFYAHAWDTFRASVGLAYGKFSILREGANPLEVPLWPVLDMWWRF